MSEDDLHENVQPAGAANILFNPQSAIRNPPSPHPLEHRLIFKNICRPDWKTDIDTYIGDGGYEQLKKAGTMSRIDIVNKVKTSGLRGRGAAGFHGGQYGGF